MKPGARPELEVQLARLTAAGTLWWVFIGIAGAAYVLSAPSLWQQALGLMVTVLAGCGIAIFATASRQYRSAAAGADGTSRETCLADLADGTVPAPEVRAA